MKRNAVVSFNLAGVNLNQYNLAIPSSFTSLELSNGEIQSMTSWEVKVTIGGDERKLINIAAFEALLYSAAQASSQNSGNAGIPVSFIFGWQGEEGNISSYASYNGFTLKFSVTTNGRYMQYTLQGFASLAIQSSLPVLRIPEVSGLVQPSAVVEGLAKAVKADVYYELDIDHNDAPVLINHGALNTSFNKYVRGSLSTVDDYDSFPGLLSLSKSYNASREAAGLKREYRKFSQVQNNVIDSPIDDFLKRSNADTLPQMSSFSYWVDEPTLNRPGTIHYKSNAGLMTSQSNDVLEYGTANTNILSLSGSYDGVAYNMTNMEYSQVGFVLDISGNDIVQINEPVNSWSSTLADVFQTSSIVNDVNAIASQFSGQFSVQIPGNVNQYHIAQPVSLLVVSGGTVSPVTGIYNIIGVSHSITNHFITTLKIQRLVMSSANQVAINQGIMINGSGAYPSNTYHTTRNIESPYRVNFGKIYPDFTQLAVGAN